MYQLPSQLTIAQVDECRAELLSFIDENNTITINSEGVEKIDTIGAQLLLAVVTHIQAQNKELNWDCSSKVIQKSFDQLGLTDTILTQYINI